ncbi:hypothetical protein BRADI_2g17063v3 [Brachypodium distachyon]|uniref:Uncharacterized protein n=1 Tax=Brachypodium distachyon TaxID=15368 RepID=A0A2K2D8X2_BRADI|nr:hypothetical protein BRADI_2g17063v3 [Brachypodium distachyon]
MLISNTPPPAPAPASSIDEGAPPTPATALASTPTPTFVRSPALEEHNFSSGNSSGGSLPLWGSKKRSRAFASSSSKSPAPTQPPPVPASVTTFKPSNSAGFIPAPEAAREALLGRTWQFPHQRERRVRSEQSAPVARQPPQEPAPEMRQPQQQQPVFVARQPARELPGRQQPPREAARKGRTAPTAAEKGKAIVMPTASTVPKKRRTATEAGNDVAQTLAAMSAQRKLILPKFRLELSMDQKEEDFMLMTGGKLPCRPMKHPRTVDQNKIKHKAACCCSLPSSCCSGAARPPPLLRGEKGRDRGVRRATAACVCPPPELLAAPHRLCCGRPPAPLRRRARYPAPPRTACLPLLPMTAAPPRRRPCSSRHLPPHARSVGRSRVTEREGERARAAAACPAAESAPCYRASRRRCRPSLRRRRPQPLPPLASPQHLARRPSPHRGLQ